MRDIIKCEWLDAKCSLDGEIPELPTMISVGYLYSKDKTKTVIVSLVGSDNDPRIVTCIPTCLVKKITKLAIKK